MMVVAVFLAAAARASAGADDLAVQAVHNYAACAAERTPEGARAVLAMDYRTPEYQKRLRTFMKGHDYCIGRSATLGSSELLMAGSLAEAMLKTEVPAGQLPPRLALDPTREIFEARSPSEEMALCTVFQDPGGTAKIFDTEPATRDEANALNPLGKVLTECLKRGTQVTLNKPALRALLALAAWRIVTTPRKATS